MRKKKIFLDVAAAQERSYDMSQIFDIQTFASIVTHGTGTYGFSSVNRTTNMHSENGSGNGRSVMEYYDAVLLENALPNFHYIQFGATQLLKSRNGKTVVWGCSRNFETDVSTVTATKSQYGDYVSVPDTLPVTEIDQIILTIIKENGIQAGLTLDTVTRNAIFANCPNVYYCGGDSITSVTGVNKLTSGDVTHATKILSQQNVPKIDGSYVAIIHPSAACDIRQNNRWVETCNYDSVKKLFNGEIGELYGVRFVETANALVKNVNGIPTYHCLFFGKDAYGVIKPDDMSLETIIKSKEQVGGPLEHFATVGWKAMHCAKVLYPERMIDVICNSSFDEIDMST